MQSDMAASENGGIDKHQPFSGQMNIVTRRDFLLAAISTLLTTRVYASDTIITDELFKADGANIKSWRQIQSLMVALADANADQRISNQSLLEHAVKTLKQLNIKSADLSQAVDNAYESGNQYWLWQRLVKNKNINGGILTINHQLVPLHDHPGATGIVRIISGEAEIWQFNAVTSGKKHDGKAREEKSSITQGNVVLKRVAHRLLKPGDIAVLTPEQGNIHALRAAGKQCRMFDFFIPPYNRSRRSWYQPLTDNWFNNESIACRKIPQHDFSLA